MNEVVDHLIGPIFDHAPVGIQIYDRDGFSLRINEAFRRMFGLPSLRYGIGVYNILHDGLAQRSGLSALFARAYQGAVLQGHQISVDLSTSDNPWDTARRLVHFEQDIFPLRDPQGQVIAVVSFVRDITERKRAEQELVRAREAAEQAARARADFLANVSHEIRTPLHAILGFTELLLSGSQSIFQQQSHLQTVRRNSEYLLSLIDNILDFTKIEAGKMSVERIPCSPAALLLDIEALQRAQAQDKGLTFSVVLEGPLPVTIQSDPVRLRQVLMNLVGNAIKFTAAGSVQVSASCDVAAQRLTLQVRDSGVGISPDAEQRIFQAFEQGDASTSRHFGGTGLGLPICLHLLRLLGGTLSVRSAPGQGSTFTATVATGPLTGVALLDTLQAPGPALPPTRSAEPPQLCGSILLVEDGPDSRELLRFFLEETGAVVFTAENGMEALALVESARRPFDLIFMDMQMPELDGYEATRRLRARGHQGPVVAVTAHSMAEDRERCLAAGCDDYLAKPLTRAVLQRAAQRHLSGSRAAAAALARRSRYADNARLWPAVERFAANLPGRLLALQVAHLRGDGQLLLQLAHQLSGAAGSYGFAAIGEAAKALERALGDGDGAQQLDVHLQELSRLIED